MMNVTVSGGDSLAAKLKNAGPRIRRAASDVVGEETVEIANDMRAAAPVDTGALRDGIQAEHSDLHGRAVSTARHSIYVEFGTSKMTEQPFMVPTAEQHRRPYRVHMAERIDRELGDL